MRLRHVVKAHVLLVGSGVERVLDRPSPRSPNTQNYFTTYAGEVRDSSFNEDGKLNISGDRGDLLPPH